MIRERIVRFHYDDTALEFITDREIADFQNAVGRVMVFGLRSKQNNGVEFVEASMSKFGDITAAFYPPIAWNIDGSSITQFDSLDTALNTFRMEEPVVVRAVPDASGRYNVF